MSLSHQLKQLNYYWIDLLRGPLLVYERLSAITTRAAMEISDFLKRMVDRDSLLDYLIYRLAKASRTLMIQAD